MNDLIKYLIEVYKKPVGWKDSDEKISVGEFSTKLASAYEKFRNIFEYNEEHLVRRHAMSRILKRRITSGNNSSKIARSLVEELIRAKYLPNNTLPVDIISVVEAIISKYIYIYNNISSGLKLKTKNKVFDWVINIAVVEIEEALIPHHRENALLDVMYKTARKNVVFKTSIDSKRKDIYVFVASARSLFQVDNNWIAYKLLNITYKNWTAHNPKEVNDFINNFWSVKKNIDNIIYNKTVDKLSKNLKALAVYFLIIDGVLRKYPQDSDKIFSDSHILSQLVRKECEKRYKHSKEVLRRSAVRSVLFIFFTKIILAFIIEIPFDMFYHGKILFVPLFTNILFHPALLMFISSATKIPSHRNTKNIIDGINWIVYGISDKKRIIFSELRVSATNTTRGIVATFLYFMMYVITFGILIAVLDKLGFNIVSMFLFLLFLSLVSFFAIRIRQTARRLVVEDKKENFFTALFDLFTLPIVRAGRWISLKSSKINIFVFILDFIIETPFKMLVELFDDLFAFIKEKKEEIY